MFNPLATFAYDPHNIQTIFFQTQQPNENVKLFIRRAPITNFPWIATVAFALFVPLLITVLIPTSNIFDTIPFLALFLPFEWIIIGILYYLVVLYYGFLKFMEWHYHVLIVTNLRVVDFNFILPFTVQTTQAQLQEVQDIRHTQRGIFATIFNFGSIFIQTAGTKQNIYLAAIPTPHKVHDVIIQLLP